MKTTEFGAFVELKKGTDGLLHVSNVGPGRVEHIEDVIERGDVLDVLVQEVDKARGRIGLKLVGEARERLDRPAGGADRAGEGRADARAATSGRARRRRPARRRPRPRPSGGGRDRGAPRRLTPEPGSEHRVRRLPTGSRLGASSSDPATPCSSRSPGSGSAGASALARRPARSSASGRRRPARLGGVLLALAFFGRRHQALEDVAAIAPSCRSAPTRASRASVVASLCPEHGGVAILAAGSGSWTPASGILAGMLAAMGFASLVLRPRRLVGERDSRAACGRRRALAALYVRRA